MEKIIHSGIPVLYNKKLVTKLYKKGKQGNAEQEIEEADYLGLK